MTVHDEGARQRAVGELGTSVALSAGAGSGKTTVLARRVAALLAAGVAPRRIAAITFTEKAAGELAQRVRDTLDAAARARPELAPIVDELPEMVVSTIHSFCLGLLRAEALEAGWAPATALQPQVFEAPEVETAFRGWLAGFRERHPLPALLVRDGVKDVTLRGALVRALSVRDLRPAELAPPLDPARAHRELVAARDEVEDAARACRAPATDKLLEHNEPVRRLLAHAAAASPADGIALVLGTEIKPHRGGGRQQEWEEGGKERFVAALDGFTACVGRARAGVHAVLVRDVWEHFFPAVRAAKRAGAVADHDDQLHLAAELLRDPAVRARLSRRYERLLIDEVQDTDPIQAEIAALLTRPPAANGEWDAASPEPGRLFAVGDPRQSIYRFRRADVALWDALRELIVADGVALDLTANFRSVPGIVAWVNTTFAELPGYVPQQAVRPPGPLDPVVRLVSTPERELEDVARYLRALHGREVVDRDSGEARPLRWSDVMVLLPGWTRAERVQQTLARAGIPCVVEGGGAFFRREEVQLGLALLRSLDDPADELATALVLRGWFGVDWETLARHRAAGGSWRYVAPEQPPGPVADAFALLLSLARERGRGSWVELLDAALVETRAAAVWAARADGEARLANLDKLRALIRKAEATVHAPGQVVAELVAMSEGRDEDDLSRVDDDHHAVRITSYFKAKGLEAPVVVLAAAQRGRAGVDLAVDRAARTVAWKVGDFVPPGWDARWAEERAADDAERARWMYVAATRARDQLVFVERADANLLEHLAAGREGAETVEGASLPDIDWRDETFPGHDVAVDGWLREEPAAREPDPVEAWRDERRAAVAAAKAASTRWRSVSEIAHTETVSGPPSPVGVVGGTVVHEVMEALDLSWPVEALLPLVPALVEASAAANGLAEAKVPLCAAIVEGMLRDPVLTRARAAPERWVEVPFAYRDGEQVISGRIDLCFPTDPSRRRWVVVDWKSDLPAKGTPARANYERQLALYAQALLRTVSPCEEVEAVLVGPHPELDE